MNDLDALEQAARGVRDGTLVYDYPTFQLLIAAVREADALREERAALILDEHHTAECWAWMYRVTNKATRDRDCICAHAALSPTEPAEDAE